MSAPEAAPAAPELPEGVIAVRVGPGANCSSAGSAIDVLFYGSVIVGAIAVALAAAFPPRDIGHDGGASEGPPNPPDSVGGASGRGGGARGHEGGPSEAPPNPPGVDLGPEPAAGDQK